MLQSMGSQRVGQDLAIEQQQRSCRMFLRLKGTKQSLKPHGVSGLCMCVGRKTSEWEEIERWRKELQALDSLEVKLPSLLSQAQAGLE